MALIIEKASSEICGQTVGRNMRQSSLFIQFDLEVQMFPTQQQQLSFTYCTQDSCKRMIVLTYTLKSSSKLQQAVLQNNKVKKKVHLWSLIFLL